MAKPLASLPLCISPLRSEAFEAGHHQQSKQSVYTRVKSESECIHSFIPRLPWSDYTKWTPYMAANMIKFSWEMSEKGPERRDPEGNLPGYLLNEEALKSSFSFSFLPQTWRRELKAFLCSSQLPSRASNTPIWLWTKKKNKVFITSVRPIISHTRKQLLLRFLKDWPGAGDFFKHWLQKPFIFFSSRFPILQRDEKRREGKKSA